MARILVADDESALRQLVRVVCQGKGHDVYEVGNAPAAIEACVHLRPDLLILDMQMPAGGGDRVLRSIRTGRDPLPFPVLVVTGAMAGTPDEVRNRLDVSAVLFKPCLMKDIETAVAMVLGPTPPAPRAPA